MEETKRCPYCAELINKEAIKCKHCGEILDPQIRAARGAQLPQPAQVLTIQQRERLWSPGVAGLLSFLIPGAGQMYKGNVGAGILWLIAVIIGYMLFVIPGIILHIICISNAGSGDPHKQY